MDQNKLLMLQYEPASPKHLLLHRSMKKVRAIFGGNRGGKTRWGMQEVLWTIFGIHPFYPPFDPPINVRICVTNENQGIKEIMLPLLKEVLPPGAGHWNAEPRTMDVATGDGNIAHIEFLTYEQDVDKFGGTSRHLVWMDEEPRLRAQFVQNIMRTVDTRGRLLMTMTPLFGMTWAYNEICEGNPDFVDYQHISIYDNKFLPKDEIELIEKAVDPAMADAVLYGRFISPTGLVYKEFDHVTHVIPPCKRIKDEWMVILGIDTHESMRNPQAVVFCAVTPEKEIVVFDEIMESCLIDELAGMIKDKLKEWDVDYRFAVMDISQQSAVAGVSHDTELKKHGIKKIKIADKKKGSPQEGRSKVKALLKQEKDEEGKVIRRPGLYIAENCVNVIREIRHYIYEDWMGRAGDRKSPKEEVRKKDDHLLDALRYVVQENIQYRSKTFAIPEPKVDGKHLIRLSR